ncbi:MAG: hypothetical protein QNJ32_29345, partial [Xenococcaceae cyanobacterium MO_167.B27]|nr:hypothetical protein [Xenococcaceae cyanobacterium MO_167.B27]
MGYNRLIPTKYHNPCPICSDISGDCRIRSDNLILCHTYIQEDSGIGGYRFVKTSADGLWGVHAPDDGKEFNREQYERNKEIREELARNKKQFLEDNALDAIARDKAIRKLSRNIGLNKRARQDLKRRGLSDSAISAGLFFNIDPWIRFNLNLPSNLP